jgi:hypothetical protein
MGKSHKDQRADIMEMAWKLHAFEQTVSSIERKTAKFFESIGGRSTGFTSEDLEHHFIRYQPPRNPFKW